MAFLAFAHGENKHRAIFVVHLRRFQLTGKEVNKFLVIFQSCWETLMLLSKWMETVHFQTFKNVYICCQYTNYRAFFTMTTLLKPKSWHLAFYLINPNCCLLCAVLRVSQVSQWHSVEATGAAFFSCFLEFWNIGEWMRQSLVCWMPCSGGSVTGQASRPCLLSPCPGRAGVYVTFMSQKQTRIHNPASSQGFSFGFLICVFESQSWLKISAVLFSISPDCAKIIRGIFTFIASTFNLSLCRWQTQTYRIALLNVA